ncbi:MAG TPA: ATP-dependent endonuclease [Pirellulales bacterium]|nr:ATP-dependent endonuclease [Pirellulales bacterium]
MTERDNLFQRIWKALRARSANPSKRAARSLRPAAAAGRPILIVVEGRNDIEFLRKASAVLRNADDALPDLGHLERRGRVVFVPFGGDPRQWVFRFAELGRPEFHLFDREVAPATEIRREAARIINLRPDSHAAMTSKRSVENYLHRDAILEARGIQVHFSDDDDVADLVAQQCFLQFHPSEPWSEQSVRARRRLRNRVKSWLNTSAVDRMTAARFAERDPAGEIRDWLCVIAEMAGGSS